MTYSDKGAADMWADYLRAEHARRVEATKRMTKYRTEVSKFTVINIDTFVDIDRQCADAHS